MFDRISKYITDMIYETMPDIKHDRREVIEYGVYMTVSEIVKIVAIIIISAFLGIVPHVLCVTGVFGVLRMLLGGVHAKSHWGCMLSHSAIVFCTVALSFVLRVEKLYLLMPVAVFSFIAAYKYAPADLPQKPIKSKKQRKQLRIGGFILLAVIFTTSCFLDRPWTYILLLSCLVHAFLMTPLVYRITKNKYGREEASSV